MNECYKLVITKAGRDGRTVSMAIAYQMLAEALIAVEEDFERWKKEPGVEELHLMRVDSQGVKELRRYVKQ